jgi:hypothetical protein
MGREEEQNLMGAETVDYEKIAAAAVQAMTPSDIHRFLVVGALVSDLYCPGYNPRQPLARDLRLANTAAPYTVAIARTTAAVRAELSKIKNNRRSESKARSELRNAATAIRRCLMRK